jgi:hypothetical protein
VIDPRAFSDEPPPPRRAPGEKLPKPVNKVRVLSIVAIAILIGSIILVALHEGAVDENAIVEAQRENKIVKKEEAPVEAVEKAIDKKKTKSKKAQLLKEELKKREAEKKIAQASTEKKSLGIEGTGAAGNTIALTGDASFKRSLVSKLRGVRVVDSNPAYSVSLRLQKGAHGDGTIYAKCSAAIAQMPGNRLIGGLASEAAVAGDGSRASLERDAMDACAGSLADDLKQWLSKR